MSNVVPLFAAQVVPEVKAPDVTASPAAWGELVLKNPHLPGEIRASIEAVLKSLDSWEQDPNSRTAYVLDACLSNMARELIPMQRSQSLTKSRTAEFSADYVAERAARYAEDHAERIKRNRAAGAAKAKATRAANKAKAEQDNYQDDED